MLWRRLASRLPLALFAATALFAACAPPNPPATPTVRPTLASTALPTPAPTATATAYAADAEIVTWLTVDDPAAPNAGNPALESLIAQFNAATRSAPAWVNQPQPRDTIAAILTAAVHTDGQAPDVVQLDAEALMLALNNDTLADLSEWASDQPWFSQIDTGTMAACTGPDGRLYCVPQALAPYVIVYWTQHFPEGFPRTADAFLQRAEALKSNSLPAIAFDEAGGDFIWMLLGTHGRPLDDGAGRMTLNTPQTVQVVELLRALTRNGLTADSDAFASARSAALAARFDRLTRLQRLSSPSDKAYTGDALGAALAAAEAKLAPIFAPAGAAAPAGCATDIHVLAIPKGARNEPGARALIRWLMSDDHAGDWTAQLGGVPVRKIAGWSAPAALAAQATATTGGCKPWQGTLKDVAGARALILDTLVALTSGAESDNPNIASVLARAEDEYNAKNAPQ